MVDLLFELGCEELPASFVADAVQQLKTGIQNRLLESEITFGEVNFGATPRRLIIGIVGLSEKQPDRIKESRGPAVKASFDDAGNPTKAVEGFCRGQNISPSDLIIEGDYVWARVPAPGLPTSDLLAELLPSAVRAMTFEKTMRWGSGRMKFARPIRWIVAALGGTLIPFEIEGIKSGLKSRGHRFNFPEEFGVTTFPGLMAELRKREVEPDPEIRRNRIIDQAKTACSGIPILTDCLVDENVYLTEWPQAVEGTFPEDYLALPRPVLVTAMAKHERFFPVQDKEGHLLPKFVAIRNAGEEDTVRKGCEWVLNARFNDAKFFFEEDQRSTMDDFLAKTERMTFQEKLGSVRQRADRLSKLAELIAEQTGATEEEVIFARQAGLYAKADLSSGLVGELASLQGVIGGSYARREGMADAVCHAISTQYDLAKNESPACEGARTAVRLVMADQLDKLAGYLGIGLLPSGSSDPFGLRRAATILIETAWSWPGDPINFSPLFDAALGLYSPVNLDETRAKEKFAETLVSRYESLLSHERHDVIQAAIRGGKPDDVAEPQQFLARTKVLSLIAQDSGLLQAASRPLNILASCRKKGMEIEVGVTGDLQSPEADALQKAVLDIAPSDLLALKGCGAADVALRVVKRLEAPIHLFFESTMVLDDDPLIRQNRLALMVQIEEIFMQVGDLTKIVQDGK